MGGELGTVPTRRGADVAGKGLVGAPKYHAIDASPAAKACLQAGG